MVLTFEKALPSQQAEIGRVFRDAFASYVRKLGRDLSPAWLGNAVECGMSISRSIRASLSAPSRRCRGKDEIIVDQIAVDPTRQGAGVGGWLLEQKKKQFDPMTYARVLSTQLK